MPTPPAGYCVEADLRTGDLATPSYTTQAQYIENAAEEIDAALGSMFVTPVVLDGADLRTRPARLLLKKINWLLASGRMILDVAAAGEQDNLNAYGKRMLDEAEMLMKGILSREISLVGAEPIERDTDDDVVTGPMIHNEDEFSLVEGFYRQRRPGLEGIMQPQVRPYGTRI